MDNRLLEDKNNVPAKTQPDPLPCGVGRSLSLVEALPFLGFDIPGILPGESYNRSLCACEVIREA